ncbi:MAG: hypothetical protein IJN22_01410 [Clostridia bacterium]|jgi:UPF0042 nucleotide-binding protein|nr:hypothetical protein [Clostridia bacterium]
MKIECRSFGFKNGAEAQTDFVFDVRCLPNPFYIEQLKHKTGLDKPVRDYVLSTEQSKEYLKKIIEMLLIVIPIKENYGVEKMTVSFGCTGGHHRSVTFAIKVCEALLTQGYDAECFHRDINIED